jgi:hypothetical protein
VRTAKLLAVKSLQFQSKGHSKVSSSAHLFSHSCVDDIVSEDDGEETCFWTEFMKAIYCNVVLESVESLGRTYFHIECNNGDRCVFLGRPRREYQPIDKYNFKVE